MTEILNPHLRAMLADIAKELGCEIPDKIAREKPGPKDHKDISPFRHSKKLVVDPLIRARQDEAKKRLEAEHRAAFARPLIDASLISDKERLEIRNRVKGSTHWRGVMFSGGAK